MDPLPASFVLDVWCCIRLFLKDAMRNLAVPRDNTRMHLLYSNVPLPLVRNLIEEAQASGHEFLQENGYTFFIEQKDKCMHA